jgi:hypothetical protein
MERFILRPHQLEATEYFLQEGCVEEHVLREHGHVIAENIQRVYQHIEEFPDTEIVLDEVRSDICPEKEKCLLYSLYECDSYRCRLGEKRIARQHGWKFGEPLPARNLIRTNF